MTKKRWITDLNDPRTALILSSVLLAFMLVLAPGAIRDGGSYGVFVAVVLALTVVRFALSARQVARMRRSQP